MTDSWAGLSRERMQALLGRYADQRIGVTGDLALDAYWYLVWTSS